MLASALSALAALLWISGLIDIFFDHALLADARLTVFIVFLLLSLLLATRLTRTVMVITTIVSVYWIYVRQDFSLIIDALRFALVFTVFLPALVFIRETLEASPEIGRARNSFLSLPDGQRSTGLVIGSQLLGSVLTLGVLAVCAPLVSENDPEPGRRQAALDVLRGVTLAVPWSPFTIGIVYVLGFRPTLELHEVLITGFMLSVLYTVVSIIQQAGLRGLGAVPQSLRVFAPLIKPIVLSVATVLLLATVTPLSTLESVALAMPVLCMARLATIGRYPARDTLGRIYSRIGATGNELLLFASAVTLGFLIQRSGLAEQIVLVLTLDSMPLPLAIAFLLSTGALLCLSGMHSILVGTVIAALISPLDERLPDIIEAHIILFGWMCGAMLSYGSLSVGLATRLFDVRISRLIFSPSLVYTLWLIAVVTAVFSVWTSIPWLAEN